MHRIETYVTLERIFITIISVLYLPILFMPITFTPETHTLNLVPFNFTDFNQFVVEKVPNIMLFIPLGFFMPIVFKSTRKFYKTVLISFAITFSIEFFQYFIGRSSDIDDIITNLLGAIIGYVIFFITNKMFKNQKWWNKLIKND